MPTENEATPQPLMKPNSRITGYSAGVTFGTVTRMNTSPHMPTIEAPNSVSIGRRPPTLSTQAPNGMRSSEPVSCGAATSRPTSSGESCIDCWKACAAGPYSDRGEADEEAPGAHDQALARGALQAGARNRGGSLGRDIRRVIPSIARSPCSERQPPAGLK